jgi:hypothetical protein
MLGLPILAIAALVLVLTLGNDSGSKKAEANVGAGYTGHLSVGACTGPKCNAAQGSVVTVVVNMDTITAGYDGFSIDINNTVGNCKAANSNAWATAHTDFSACLAPGQAEVAAAKNATTPPTAPSTQKGAIGEFTVNCTTSGTLTNDGASFVVNGTSGGSDPIAIADLALNCVPATQTSTPTSTATPLPGIQMQKCFNSDTTFGNDCEQSANLFLTDRQPSAICGDNEGVTLTEGISNLPPNTTTKGEEGIGAFQFEIRYPKGVCIEFTAASSTAACTVIDGGKGVANVGCATIGKANNSLYQNVLGSISVRLEKETVAALRPAQDNGIALQILDQDCQLADKQGHPIALLSCEDAEISVRFLEGDVVPNCAVDGADLTDIAMRWGANQGNQLYQTFKDISPSGQQKGDTHIHIDDVQAVFGRFGSTCDVPHPPQPPFSGKK